MLAFLYYHLFPRLVFGTRDSRAAYARRILGSLVTYALDGAEQPVHSSTHAQQLQTLLGKEAATLGHHPRSRSTRRAHSLALGIMWRRHQ